MSSRQTSNRESLSKTTQHILTFRHCQRKQFLKEFDLVIIACEGVLWSLTGEYPDVEKALSFFNTFGKSLKFISNLSTRTKEECRQRLNAFNFGYTVQSNDLIHPSTTLVSYIKGKLAGKRIYSLCNPVVNAFLRKNNIPILTTEPATNMKISNLSKFIKPDTTQKVDAVVLGLNLDLTYNQLAHAHVHLTAPNCKFFAMTAEVLVPVTKTKQTLGMHGFVSLLKESSGKEPILIGKPGINLVEDIGAQFEIKNPDRVLYIGSNIQSDIIFAESCGYQTMLVLSGVSNIDEILATPDSKKPDYVINGIEDFITFFKKETKCTLKKAPKVDDRKV